MDHIVRGDDGVFSIRNRQRGLAVEGVVVCQESGVMEEVAVVETTSLD
jgi:hypothetical protein